jgi:hypothetical protein
MLVDVVSKYTASSLALLKTRPQLDDGVNSEDGHETRNETLASCYVTSKFPLSHFLLLSSLRYVSLLTMNGR